MSRWQANRRGGEKFASHRRPSANRRIDCVPVVLAVFGTSAGLRGFPIPNSLESPTWIEPCLSDLPCLPNSSGTSALHHSFPEVCRLSVHLRVLPLVRERSRLACSAP